jgi:hypothetical protein
MFVNCPHTSSYMFLAHAPACSRVQDGTGDSMAMEWEEWEDEEEDYEEEDW